ncbi:NAD-dependent epimerase/dehydratase family protein [Rhizobium leguminosarum]|uniref:NAD-dependent epimerase/dehydratase family protein n=1 Tax=Rhizobium ruizarguesonis TaxID=2081791 RepID=UPI001031B3A8|nr:NAD(P)-dependent oxidoreductase [Rhizobium ruizarguesonis]NEI14608.1 NAD-dependent epimerase/dehydratase family protein [Rhizobium ruizarguesonis]TAW76188.1 NAD(P)-dependent oxidoreductase [Rhizobium ruizarguesonis]TAX13143.1 NAD(P)-dependent oxidoreductase [Rhizobium ruizarguesonis]TAX17974.1 NAD(P)-dependent oxidoreductase [Rhizobium ruizarguesonis]
MRVLLTGASGYIGLHILDELLRGGHEITALVRSEAKLSAFMQEPRLKIVSVDLAQENRFAEALDGCQAVIHAALVWGEPGEEFELKDTIAAAKLFEAAGPAGIERCIFISSVAVHRPFTGEMNEDQALAPIDIYGATKAAGELFLRAACAQHQMTGIVVRPGPVVGPPSVVGSPFRTERRINSMVAAARAGRPIEVEAGDGRQFSGLATVAKSVSLLTNLDNPDPTYICVDRSILTWEWIARQVVACAGSSSEVHLLPATGERPVPRFSTSRIEKLLGRATDTRSSLVAHINHLVKFSGEFAN